MLISALMIGFCTAFASAATPVWLLRAKAGIAAAMMAANIAFEPIQAVAQEALINSIDPIGIVDTITSTPWDRYIDQSVIVVRPDYVTIDGQEYSEIWLGQKAANSLRASGFDFTTAYNILANQSEAVSYATGEGYVNDEFPIYSVNGVRRTPTYQISPVNGSYDISGLGTVVVEGSSTTTKSTKYHRLTGTDYSLWSASSIENAFPYSVYNTIRWNSNRYETCGYVNTAHGLSKNTGYYSISGLADFDEEPFEYDYTSGVIDAEPISPEDGLLIRVPSEYVDVDPDSPYNYNIPDFVNTYPDYDGNHGRQLVFDPNLNPDFDVDLDMGNALGDLITAVILAKLADLLGDSAETIYAPMPEKDQPAVIDPLPDPDPAPDDPSPGTTIADTDWTKLDEILRWIQSTIDSIRHLTESLQTMLDNIIQGIRDILQQISEIPDAIRELADKILEDIELGPSKLFDKALDILKTLFLPLLLPIRAMMNLWHYVVEWIQSVSSPFTWIFGIMSGTSYNMVLPIYALLAGGICISIYKALGR